MNKPLKIKDSVFGYITVDDDDIYTVVNSSMFHRLQDIIQTSYTSVYPSAVHNRFVHSLGVYFLGGISAEKLSSDIERLKLLNPSEIQKLRKTFILACLMHDIGHSPFSHTGERFYIQDSKENPKIWTSLVEELDNDSLFIEDSKNKLYGKPHEVMSALVSLKYYKDLFVNLDKSFFVRCIIGLKYSDKSDIKNCFIEMLNSNTIDVDKLDYLIRDSYFTGFDTVKIDYKRLLSSVCIIRKEDCVELGFEKSALSTLESVIMAHDMERKWIQNHPVIKYEDHLITYMISVVQDRFLENGVELFTPEALSDVGIGEGEYKAVLLSDSDINAFAKRNINNDRVIKEYYSRNLRKKALWKSESEYVLYMESRGGDEKLLQELENRIISLEDSLITKFGFPIINEEALSYLEKETETDFIPDDVLKDGKKQELRKALAIVQYLKNYSKNNNIPFEFVIASANQFSTGYNKIDFKNIKIKFTETKFEILDNILKLVSANTSGRDNYFYIMVDTCSKIKIDVDLFSKELMKFIFSEYNK